MRNLKATSVFLLGLVVVSLAGSRALRGQAGVSQQENLTEYLLTATLYK